MSSLVYALVGKAGHGNLGVLRSIFSSLVIKNPVETAKIIILATGLSSVLVGAKP